MIVLIGIASEPPLAMVRDALQRAGADFLLLNQRHALDWDIDLTYDRGALRGALGQSAQRIDAGAVTGVFARPMDARFLPEVEAGGPDALRRASAAHDAIIQWLEVAPGAIINRPAAMMSNGSKPYQAQLIADVGFDVPETLITSDPAEAEAFWRRHGRIIFKSISGARSIVTEMTDDRRARLGLLDNCPVQFQEYIEGVDVRVHIIGQRAIATRVESDDADYRYAGPDGAALAPAELPPEIEARAIDLAGRLGLAFAGIDLRCADDGRWICFEVNPCPAFSYYEARAGQPIADAVADFLIAGAA